MIRVDFIYKVKTQDKGKMLENFQKSADSRFNSRPSNIKMEMATREAFDFTYFSLNIYYKSEQDYLARTSFEQSNPEWMNIWFKPNDFFELVSRIVYEVAD